MEKELLLLEYVLSSFFSWGNLQSFEREGSDSEECSKKVST